MRAKKLKLSSIDKSYHAPAMKGFFVDGHEIIVVAPDHAVLKTAFEKLSMVGEFNKSLARMVKVSADL